MKVIKIHTDGGYKSKNKIGACAFIIVKDDEVLVESVKSYNKIENPEMTINQMELKAVIDALNWLRSNNHKPKEYVIYVYTDSQYVQLGVNKWLEKRKNGSYSGFWTHLDKLINFFNEFTSLYIQWIESDNQDVYHKRVDELCTIAMKKIDYEINVTT